MTNAHSEMGQMAVCCQNLNLSVLSTRSILSMLVGALFKKLALLLNSPFILICASVGCALQLFAINTMTP
jgi:hypothetical protein